MVKIRLVAGAKVDGFIVAIFGPASMVKQFVQAVVPPLELVIVRLRDPIGAVPETLTVASTVVALTQVLEVTVTPVPLTVIDAALSKLFPVSVIIALQAP